MDTLDPPAPGLDRTALAAFVDKTWEGDIVPALAEYIRIPNKSPLFDSAWREHGHMDRAVDLIEAWCGERSIPGLQVDVVRLPDRTPLLFVEVPGEGQGTVLLYGHLDKQPEMTGWRAGLGPWTPVREGERLYGRGGADDGYAAFAALTAIEAVQRHGGSHARCVVLIEACEESGSYDLPHYIDALADRIGTPDLVICLDSGCGNYEQLWLTTSLRGIVIGTLHVGVLEEGVHSGDAGGVVPSSFRIARALLSRLEDEATGRPRLDALQTEIPEGRVLQARAAAAVLGIATWTRFPWQPGVVPMHQDPAEIVLDRTWRASIEVTGAEGLPPLDRAGNVLRPETALKLSVRVPPNADAHQAALCMKEVLETDPPQGAQVRFDIESPGDGWEAPPLAPWLGDAVDAASQQFFGLPAVAMGEGGSIPFMGMLGARFPDAQFVITGVLGPGSNAHGPNEFIHIPTGARVTSCVAHLLDAHARRG